MIGSRGGGVQRSPRGLKLLLRRWRKRAFRAFYGITDAAPLARIGRRLLGSLNQRGTARMSQEACLSSVTAQRRCHEAVSEARSLRSSPRPARGPEVGRHAEGADGAFMVVVEA